MSLHTNCHAPRTTLSGRIQIGHKSGFCYLLLLFIYLFRVNIKPPRHRFGLSLCLGLAITNKYNQKLLYVKDNEIYRLESCD